MHALDDLVLHIGDIHHVTGGEAAEFEVAADEIGENEGAEIADVGEIVDGRAAAIHADGLAGGVERCKKLHTASQCVEKAHGHGNKPGAD